MTGPTHSKAVETPYERLERMGIILPTAPLPVANFVTHVVEGGHIYLSGQGPREPDGRMHCGKVGRTVSVEMAYSHARLTGINLLAVLHEALGDLARVRRVVKLFGMVNADAEFEDHPSVINGCSDLFVEVFGDTGLHARSAVGVASLPGQITVEIEAVFAV